MLNSWEGVAFNQVPHSKNEIHGDRVARDFGFKGGLVPGVTVSAYLLHPAAEAFGMAFLERGVANVKVIRPLYDEDSFSVELRAPQEDGYEAQLVSSDGTLCATASVRVPDLAPPELAPPDLASEAPARRGDPLADRDDVPFAATRANMELLRERGCRAFVYRFDDTHDMSTYLRDRQLMASPYRQGYANPSFILGVSNWVLASNALMNPWVHMETTSWHFAPIADGEKVVGEMQVTDLFEKKGHEFVDARVNVFGVDDDRCRASIDLRAIYRLRGSEEA